MAASKNIMEMSVERRTTSKELRMFLAAETSQSNQNSKPRILDSRDQGRVE
jgi:hypothetical protein